MTIYVVSEENHGEIIYAASEEAAKRALLETDWVGQYSDIWIENEEENTAAIISLLWNSMVRIGKKNS